MSTDKRNRVDKGVSTGGQFAKESKAEDSRVALGASPASRPHNPLQSRSERNHLLAQMELLNANDAVHWARGVKSEYPEAVSFSVDDVRADSPLDNGISYQDASGQTVEIDESDIDEFSVECPVRDDFKLQADLEESGGSITFASMEERYERAVEACAESTRAGDASLKPTSNTAVTAWTGEDGVQVVQIDHDNGSPIRVNVNDGPVFEGDPETTDARGQAFASLIERDHALQRNLSTPPDLPNGYDPEAVKVEFDSDGDAYVSIEVPSGKGSGKVALWARDVAGVFETGSNINEGGESVAWENPDDEYDVLEHLETVATNLHYAKLHAMEKVTKDQGFIEAASQLARQGR